MTKAELIAAMKDFPDDMEVWLEVNGGVTDLQHIEIEKYEYWVSQRVPLDDEYKTGIRILLRGSR